MQIMPSSPVLTKISAPLIFVTTIARRPAEWPFREDISSAMKIAARAWWMPLKLPYRSQAHTHSESELDREELESR